MTGAGPVFTPALDVAPLNADEEALLEIEAEVQHFEVVAAHLDPRQSSARCCPGNSSALKPKFRRSRMRMGYSTPNR
jgi:hypothetical protein